MKGSRSGRMTAKPTRNRARPVIESNHLAVTVTELDRLVYDHLKGQGAARADAESPDSYVITDIEKAKSQVVMPAVLNRFGEEGWKLVAVNKMECFLFCKAENGERFEYKVLAPNDLDKLALGQLDQDGHLKVSTGEGDVPTVEITDPQKARIQDILPRVLDTIAVDGWQLVAISGPQLYFFTRVTR